MSARGWCVLLVGAAGVGCTALVGYGDPVQLASGTSEVDAAAPDAASAGDGAADAAKDAAPFCESRSPKPTFCASFDGPSYLAGWGSSDTFNVSLARDVSTFVSAPASLLVAVDRKDDGGGVNGGVSVDFTAFKGRPFTANIAFDVQVEAAAPAGALAVIANPLLIGAIGGPTYLLQLVCRPLVDGSVSVALVEVTPGTSTSEHRASEPFVTKQWARFDLSVVIASLGTTGNSARLLVDGKVAFDGPLLSPIGNGTPGITLGFATVDSSTSAWAVRFDNAIVDIR